MTLPSLYPAGGRGGWGCRPALSLVFFFAPYPPSPLPRWGRGSPKDYFAGGFAPGTPALNRLRHRLNLRCKCHGGGKIRAAYLLCRLPTLPLVCFAAPYPPDPLPRWGRGSPKVYFAGGFAPGTPTLNRLRHLQTVPNRYPEAEPGRHRSRGGVSRAGGGLAPALPANPAVSIPNGGRGGWGCRPTLPLVCFAAPYPPSPLPRWGRGRFKVISCKGLRPLHPRGCGDAALARPAVPVPGGGLCLLRGGVEVAFRYPAGGFAFFVACQPCL